MESKQSSTFRELKAILYSLQSFRSQVANQKAKVFCDNQNAARIVHVGSPVNEIQSIAVMIFEFCLENKVCTEAQWIPREQNAKADYLRRIVNPDDWKLNSRYFYMISLKWGPFDVDRMADNRNTQLKRFNSKF